ncbi:MAG: tyrosine-type recombinase/integrase, partial [Terriglobales bacterium]
LTKGVARMSVYREKSGCWTIDFWWRGSRVKRCTGLRNKPEARRAEDVLKADLARGEVGLARPRAVAFDSFVRGEYLPWFEETHPERPNTGKRRRVAARSPLIYFSGQLVALINAGDIESYKTWRLRQPGVRRGGSTVSPATVNRELDALRSIFGLAVKKGLAKVNPVKGVRFLREPQGQVRVLSFEEERKYLAVAPPRLREVARVMLETGMRPAEAFRLRREDVCLADGYVRIPLGKTAAARRTIPLSGEASKLLAVRLGQLAARDWVFPSVRGGGGPMGGVNGTHRRAVRRAKLPPFRLYDLRHTFATRAVQSGMDLPTLAGMLGHAKLNMVLRYAHPTPEHRVRAMAKLERYTMENALGSPVKSPAILTVVN